MDFRADISGFGCMMLAALCLLLPLNWLVSAVLAAGIHELCHILAVYALGGRIRSLVLSSTGAELSSTPMDIPRETGAILAGPAGSLALLFFREQAPYLALCGLVQGIFNLLPVYPLDGGRALAVACRGVFPGKTGERICDFAEKLVWLTLLAAGAWGSFGAKLGLAPVLLAAFTVTGLVRRKISCQEGILRVQ